MDLIDMTPKINKILGMVRGQRYIIELDKFMSAEAIDNFARCFHDHGWTDIVFVQEGTITRVIGADDES